MTTYVVAGGCFWCIDAVFQRLIGVESSTSGYTGGAKLTANYYTVATGITNHAESVKVCFDESILPKEILLDIFFLLHDPTTLNRQGADIGTQYRSALFYGNDEQKVDFTAAIARAQSIWEGPIVTELTRLNTFYEAEIEHQDYFTNNPSNGYCSVVVVPKIVKARKSYSKWFKENI